MTNLDIPGAALSGIFAFCLFHLYVITSPKRSTWGKVPEVIRKGIWASGAALTIRSADLLSLSGKDVWAPGHMAGNGMVVLICLTYTVGGFTIWAASKRMAGHGWDRVNWVASILRRQPNNVAVVLSMEEVVDVHRVMGSQAVAPAEFPKEWTRQFVDGQPVQDRRDLPH